MYRVNDIFCGAGGMGLAFKNAGYEITGAWDFDEQAVKSYRHNIGKHAEIADIRDMGYKDLPPADVWTFGFPCQDLSNASGNPKGLIDGKKSKMFFEVMRLLDEMDDAGQELPKIIMAENVSTLRKYLPVLEIEYYKRGYRMVYAMYNSKFWGVPQRRERYYVVGIRNDLELDFVMPEQPEEVKAILSDVLESITDDVFYMDPSGHPLIVDYVKGSDVYKIKQATKQGWILAEMGDSVNLSFPNSKTRRGRVGKRVAQTILTSPEQLVVTDKGLRYLTAREAARLQGFPDNYENVVSDNQFYKQMGNAVTVNVAEAMAKRIAEYLAASEEIQQKELYILEK